jgi:hypothetical protein
MTLQIPRNPRAWKKLLDEISPSAYPNIPPKQFEEFQIVANHAAANKDYFRWVNIYGTVPLALLILGRFILQVNWGAIIWGIALVWMGFCYYKGFQVMRANHDAALKTGREIGLFG